MKHYVLLKFENGYLDDKRLSMMREAFSGMKREIPGIIAAKVEKNIVERGSNADVMISLELEDEEALYRYIDHPLHVDFASEIRPFIEKIITFDV